MKRTLAEHVAFLMLSAALAVGAWAVTGRAACSVTAPYQFPVQPARRSGWSCPPTPVVPPCRLPRGWPEQMTSEALLETALDYPFTLQVCVQRPGGDVRKAGGPGGQRRLAELVTRPDAEEVIARALAAPAEAGEDPCGACIWRPSAPGCRSCPGWRASEASQGQAPAGAQAQQKGMDGGEFPGLFVIRRHLRGELSLQKGEGHLVVIRWGSVQLGADVVGVQPFHEVGHCECSFQNTMDALCLAAV